MKEQARAKARQLAQEFVQRGDATGWFERLYTQAQGNEQAIYWAKKEIPGGVSASTHPLKAEMGDSLVDVDSLRDTEP